MNDKELGWAAGIIDGEGCISINKNLKGIGYTIRLSVNMTHMKTIDNLQKIFKLGSINFVPARCKQWKDTYRWEVSGRNAIEIIKLVYPLLITKEEQAYTAVKFYENCMIDDKGIPRKRGYHNIELSVETLDLMQGYFLDMKVLNKKGR